MSLLEEYPMTLPAIGQIIAIKFDGETASLSRVRSVTRVGKVNALYYFQIEPVRPRPQAHDNQIIEVIVACRRDDLGWNWATGNVVHEEQIAVYYDNPNS